MRKIVVGLILLSLVVLAVAGVLSYQMIEVIAGAQSEPEGYSLSPASQPVLLEYEHLKSPYALLVLDVSGSMRKSDSGLLQAEAVFQFYDLYSSLAREILDSGDQARIGVILFATIPQVLDWTGHNDLWLSVDDSNRQLFRSAVTRFLGKPGEDRRAGQDTDYISVIHAASRMIADIDSPPAVIFMTDGYWDVHPLFSDMFPAESAVSRVPGLTARDRELVRAVRDRRYSRLSVGESEGIFDTRQLETKNTDWKPSEEEDGRIRDEIIRAVREINSHEYFYSQENPAVSANWAPLLLGANLSEETLALIEQVLGGPTDETSAVWGQGGSVSQCSSAEQLVGTFIDILANWLGLSRVRLSADATTVKVPDETHAFALHVRTAGPVGSVGLEAGDSTLALIGRDAEWAGVFPGSGEWAFDCSGSRPVEGTLYLRPRYDWVLRMPIWISPDSCQSELSTEVFLYSLEEKAPVSAEKVYGQLPPVLPATVTYDMSGLKQPFLMKYDSSQGDRNQRVYSGEFPGPSVDRGLLKITVDLRPIRSYGVWVADTSLVQVAQMRPRISLVVRDAEGERTSINVRGVPVEGAGLRRLWEKISGWF